MRKRKLTTEDVQRIERQQATIHMLENRNDKLEAFVMWIARDYVESSHDKVRIQRDDYIKRAKQLLDELYGEE